jgi:hypothetical protein
VPRHFPDRILNWNGVVKDAAAIGIKATGSKMEGWLCPALLKYFSTAPREIYLKVEPLSR